MSTAVDIETVACWFLSLKPGCKGSASTMHSGDYSLSFYIPET